MSKNIGKTVSKKLRGSLYLEYRKFPGEWIGDTKYAKKLLARKTRHELKRLSTGD